MSHSTGRSGFVPSTAAASPGRSPAPAEAAAESHNWTTLAALLRPQGRKGELLAELLTDFPDRFLQHPEVHLAPAGFTGAPTAAQSATVVSSWLPVGRNAGRVVLGFAGVDSISAAEQFAGLEVIVPDSQRVPLEEDAEYIDDLIGCTVVDVRPAAPEGSAGDAEAIAQQPFFVGTISSVEFPTGPDGIHKLSDVAPLLTVVTTGGYEVVIPFARDFLHSIDVPGREICMTLPKGLLELYGVETDMTESEEEPADQEEV